MGVGMGQRQATLQACNSLSPVTGLGQPHPSEYLHLTFMKSTGSGETAQQLKAPVALAEDQGLVPRNHLVAYSACTYSSRSDAF